MKNPVLLFTFLMLCFSCEKETNMACDVSNPLEEIAWLKEMHENFQMRQSPAGAQIFQYDYNGECAFLIIDCVNCFDGLTVVYNKNQSIICREGGIAGWNTCIDFNAGKSNEILLYDGVE